MGRYYRSKKEEADSLKKIHTWQLKNYGYFKGWGASGSLNWTNNFTGMQTSVGIQTVLGNNEDYLRIYYTQTKQDGEKKDFDYKLPLLTTPCHFGGSRYWFRCNWYANGIYCGRRVGTLYLGGDVFACRYCYNLTYSCRNLGGISKYEGAIISIPDLDNLRKIIKRQSYAGKLTRRYRSYLKKERKSKLQVMLMARFIERRHKRRHNNA